MGIQKMLLDEMKEGYNDLKTTNKGNRGRTRDQEEEKNLKEAVKALVDMDLDSDEFKTKGTVTVIPADIARIYYDKCHDNDWTKHNDNSSWKAYRTKPVVKIIVDYAKEKGFFPYTVTDFAAKKEIQIFKKENKKLEKELSEKQKERDKILKAAAEKRDATLKAKKEAKAKAEAAEAEAAEATAESTAEAAAEAEAPEAPKTDTEE